MTWKIVINKDICPHRQPQYTEVANGVVTVVGYDCYYGDGKMKCRPGDCPLREGVCRWTVVDGSNCVTKTSCNYPVEQGLGFSKRHWDKYCFNCGRKIEVVE